MGSLCPKSATLEVVQCIHEIQAVEQTLERLIHKYDAQIKNEQPLVRTKMHRKADCMRHMRTIHIIRHHKHNMEKRLTSCMNKRYQLESLNVTKMHMKAVQATTKTYRQFLDEHDIEKVERLQDTLAEMIEDACEINETLNATPQAFEVHDDELEREYDSICADLQLPTAPTGFPPFAERNIDVRSCDPESNVKNRDMELVPLTG